MGQDTYLKFLAADGSEVESLWSKGYLGILWLACFRVSDIEFDREGYIKEIECDIEAARRQLDQGVDVLRKAFPDTDFDVAESGRVRDATPRLPGISEFRRMLAETTVIRVRLATYMLFQDFSGNHMDRFMAHALLGFSQPQCKMFYDQRDFRLGLDLPPGAPASGVMTWSDVLRAFALRSLDTEFRPEGVELRLPTCLFTDAEFAISPWVLAGERWSYKIPLPA